MTGVRAIAAAAGAGRHEQREDRDQRERAAGDASSGRHRQLSVSRRKNVV